MHVGEYKEIEGRLNVNGGVVALSTDYALSADFFFLRLCMYNIVGREDYGQDKKHLSTAIIEYHCTSPF